MGSSNVLLSLLHHPLPPFYWLIPVDICTIMFAIWSKTSLLIPLSLQPLPHFSNLLCSKTLWMSCPYWLFTIPCHCFLKPTPFQLYPHPLSVFPEPFTWSTQRWGLSHHLILTPAGFDRRESLKLCLHLVFPLLGQRNKLSQNLAT